MSVQVNSLSSTSLRQRILVNDRHELFADVGAESGGESSAPDPHDYLDSALGACKALTVSLYARSKGIPLEGISVTVNRDASEERQGRYRLDVELTLKGALSEEQKTTLQRIADRCPVHKLLTASEIAIETRLVG